MIGWIRKTWAWLVGAPVVVVVLGAVFGWFRRKPDSGPVVAPPTKEQADAEHAKIDKAESEQKAEIDREIDEELKDVLKKFGG